MRPKAIRTAALLVLVFLLLLASAPRFQGASIAEADAAPHAEGEVLVKFKRSVSRTEIDQLSAASGASVTDEIPQIGVRRLRVPAKAESRVVAALRRNPKVEYAELNHIASVTDGPNDPYYVQGRQWDMTTVQAPAAWGVTAGSASVPVAILDTGIDSTHPDLTSKIVAAANFTDSATAADLYGHGTHVAGIAAAATNNGAGVAGLGYNSSLMNVKVMGDNGTGRLSWVAQGIVWATDHGARVINMSLGAQFSDQALLDAINYAWDRGVVLAAAAGNYASSTPFYPAAYPNVIGVASTDAADTRSPFSGYGDWVSVAAPGGSIWSTMIATDPMARCDGSGCYGYKAGTSMASPHVAGLAALVFTRVTDHNGNGRLNDEVRDCIQGNADDIGVDGIGSGRINAYRAVLCSNALPPATTGAITGRVSDAATGSPIQGATVTAGTAIATTDGSGNYTIAGLAAGSYNVTAGAGGYLSASQPASVIAGETVTESFALTPSAGSITGRVTDGSTGAPIAGAIVTAGAGSATTGSNGSYSIGGLTQGSYTVTASADGYRNAQQSVSVTPGVAVTASFALSPTAQPVLKAIWVSALRFTPQGKNLRITAVVSSDSGGVPGAAVALNVTNGAGAWSFAGATDSHGNVAFTIQKAPSGTYTASVAGLSAGGSTWDATKGVIAASYSQ